MARMPTEEERRAAIDSLRQSMRAVGVSTAASDEDLLRTLGDRVAVVGAKELERRAAGLPLASDYPRPNAGDRLVIRSPFQCLIGTSWRAAFSGGGEATLPAGLEFVVQHDPPEGASAAAAIPDPYDEWEELLVDKADREHPKYAGYHLVVGLDDLAAHCGPAGPAGVR
jgi:hypothetical protein